jgi:enediyne biosynthesis protein E4
VADLNNDGRLDIVVSGNDEQALLLLNNTEAGNWLIIDAVGSQSNRDAIGALVHIVDDSGREQWQAVTTASSYLSASDKRAHFGLGSAERVQLLKIRWPSGRRQELKGISANQILTVREPE